ncbi:unnamed protein product [Malus baccata var. baccata]
MPPKASKADLAKKQKVVEDKTFGLKNKNKSKNVQKYVQNLKQAVQPKVDPAKAKKEEEKAKEKELNDLFKVAVSHMYCNSHIFCNFVCCRIIEEKLFFVCKHFLDAVEKKQYGWFWSCPNGGKECHYRHALPPGYVLKSQMKALLDEEAEKVAIEDEIENQRAKVTTITPMTTELFMQWRNKRTEEKEAGLAAQRGKKIKKEFKYDYRTLANSEVFCDKTSHLTDWTCGNYQIKDDNYDASENMKLNNREIQ